jgi:hypothetical protein
MDLKKLTTGDWVVGVSAILLLIFSFFPWFDYQLEGTEGSIGDTNGWDFFLFGIIPVLIGLASAALVAVSRFTTSELPKMGSLSWAQVHLIMGVVAAVLVLLLVLIGDDESVFGLEIDGDRQVGLFLAFLAAIGLAVGGLLKTRDPADAAPPTAPPPSAPPPA